MAQDGTAPSLLTLPRELRDAIYDYIYVPPSPYPRLQVVQHAEPASAPLSLSTFGRPSPLDQPLASDSNKHLCGLLQTCKQLHAEAHLLYFSRTVFSLPGYYASPEYFAKIIAALPLAKIRHIRYITLTGRINNMRALNESWDGIAFANPDLNLNTLTIIPRRPHTHETHYAQVADLSQSYTLAYILAETFKRLKGVEKVVVRNDMECFNQVVWRLVYRSLVHRLWGWGGKSVGLKFRHDTSDQESWFEILNGTYGGEEDGWRDAHDEFRRLIE